ncbi:MAG: hypothetical protein R3B49_10760 [Phycisphaerales bacterium]
MLAVGAVWDFEPECVDLKHAASITYHRCMGSMTARYWLHEGHRHLEQIERLEAEMRGDDETPRALRAPVLIDVSPSAQDGGRSRTLDDRALSAIEEIVRPHPFVPIECFVADTALGDALLHAVGTVVGRREPLRVRVWSLNDPVDPVQILGTTAEPRS